MFYVFLYLFFVASYGICISVCSASTKNQKLFFSTDLLSDTNSIAPIYTGLTLYFRASPFFLLPDNQIAMHNHNTRLKSKKIPVFIVSKLEIRQYICVSPLQKRKIFSVFKVGEFRRSFFYAAKCEIARKANAYG